MNDLVVAQCDDSTLGIPDLTLLRKPIHRKGAKDAKRNKELSNILDLESFASVASSRFK